MSHSTFPLTRFLNRAMLVLVALLALSMPRLLAWYNTVRILSQPENQALLHGFYLCFPLVELALIFLDRLLTNIRRTRVFVPENVRLLGFVVLCAAGVSLVCLAAAWFYPPLLFLALIMAFLCPMVNVVRQVLTAAISLREENDLTI